MFSWFTICFKGTEILAFSSERYYSRSLRNSVIVQKIPLNNYSSLPNTSLVRDNSLGWGLGWGKEKTEGRIVAKGGKIRKPRAE